MNKKKDYIDQWEYYISISIIFIEDSSLYFNLLEFCFDFKFLLELRYSYPNKIYI